MSELVTVKCWKCAGSGHFAIGTCFGCDGAGTNTYTAAAYARKVAAAKGRKTAAQRRNEAARAARDAELATKTLAEINESVVSDATHELDLFDHEAKDGTRVTVEELAKQLMVAA